MRASIQAMVPMDDAEWETFCSYIRPRRLAKKEHLFTHGQVVKWVGFVNEGCLRYYLLDNAAEERIIYFAMEGWWIGDLGSFNHGQPTLNNLQALTDVELLLLERDGFEEMCARCPAWEKFYRLATQKAYAAIQDRYIQFQAMSAEEKYLWLVKKSPTLFQRVPQHYIASYLGIQPQSLSRIRKKLAVEGPDAPDPA